MQFDVLVKFLSLLLLIAIQSLAQSQGKDEEWTDISGKKTVIAEFIRLEGVQLILRKADGKELVIPLNKLDDKSRIKARAIANSSMKKGEAKFPREAANSVAFRQQPKEVTNSIGMKLVLIPAGTFTMGSPLDEVGRRGDETPHEVTISNSYYLGVYEVTQDQFEKVMGKNPSNFKEARNPVENVSWDDAVAYCKKLSELPEEKAAGREYRLPTEAEWEYACRAGSSSVYFFGDSADSLPEYAWFGEGREGNSHPVGEKKPNRWGLYDMHGNVWEWCQDSHRDYQSSAVTDPRGSGNDLFRVTRGGSWPLAAFYCRSANRDWLHASKQLAVNGFRVALSTSVKSPKAEQIKGPLDAGKKGVPTEQRSVVPPAFSQQPKEITNSIGMKLVLIPAGTFTLGSPLNEVLRRGDETPHEVTISKSFYLEVYKVTQSEYEKVMGTNPSFFKGAKNPVEMVNWEDAVSFCKKLSEFPKEKVAGREYRLPTEAEWEYSCRAGSQTAYSFGESAKSLGEYAWFDENSEGKTHPVGEKKPNRWGLYDTHGNVSEWCHDWYEPYLSGAATDPQGPNVGLERVLRGGAWIDDAGLCRSADRVKSVPSSRYSLAGFRVALSTSVK